MKKLIELQKKYNKLVYGHEQTSTLLKEKMTQELVLCAHAELSSLVEATRYKRHHAFDSSHDVDKGKLLYESVDVMRYIMAIMNVWEIDPDEFEDAFHAKDVYLHTRHRIGKTQWWPTDPVAIIDMDDVLADFRQDFSNWLYENYKIHADVESPEYYFIDALKDSGHNPERIFETFVKESGFSKLNPVKGAKEFLQELKNKGYWIHLLTARPEDNLTCLYNTYSWLKKYGIPFDDISFATEKFRWCAKSKYYDSGKIAFAIDDSPKHAQDYAVHGIKCWVPRKSYNRNIVHTDIRFYDSFKDFLSKL
jgi:5'(3')-deoxyribonucleotidase